MITQTLFKRSLPILLFGLSAGYGHRAFAQANPEKVTKETFHGEIKLDVRDSKEDWTPYLPPKAPAGAPNVLFILFDDTGLAAWSPFGGGINMPTLQSLANDGLMYTQWHTTALCSPSRSTLLTGRNHHLNGMAAITETSNGFPGANGVIPKQCATVGQILQANGWSTFWVGKDHNVSEQDVSSGATRRSWPVSLGFDRFYGYLGGETNQWYPDLVEDNKFVNQPYQPSQGYHLSIDLADHAIQMLKDEQSANPSKPWYMWFCPGANHAPHQAPADYIAKYKGKFDEGYEAYRKWVLPRMIAKGVIPPGTDLTEFNPMVPGFSNPVDSVLDWDKLKPEEKHLFSRLAEVYAGFSEFTDAQVGRVVDYLKKTGQYENTVIIYAADNGASGEGSPIGSVNENKFFNGYPDDVADNLKLLDKLGGPETYEHYPTGWAAAFSAPFKMFKRYGEYSGGTCDPLVITWPKGIKAKGETRDQYHHSTDIVPTILDVCGVEMPKEFDGVAQYPLSGVSMRYTFDSKTAPTHKKIQYYEMLGTRGLWEDGWMISSTHAALVGTGKFNEDKWELYHVETDRSEAHNVANDAANAGRMKKMIADWNSEAAKNLVLPLDDRTAVQILGIPRPTIEPLRDNYKYYPGTAAEPEGVAVNIRNKSYKIIANVDVKEGAEGVIFAHGSPFGGHALFIKNNKLVYVYNFLGINPEQTFTSNVSVTPGKHTYGMEFTRSGKGKNGECLGTMKLYIDGKEVGSGPMRTQPGKFTLDGDGLCVGWDSGAPVSSQYKAPGTFTGGTIDEVDVNVGKTDYTDLESEAKRAFQRE